MKKKDNNISLFAVSFRQGFTSPNIPIASFYQGEKKINFLLDTGSDKNILNQSSLKQFTLDKKPKNTKQPNIKLSGVGGTQDVETCVMSFTCGEETYTTNFLVTDLSHAFDMIENDHCIKLHGILGSEFLKKYNVVIDFNNLAAYSKE